MKPEFEKELEGKCKYHKYPHMCLLVPNNCHFRITDVLKAKKADDERKDKEIKELEAEIFVLKLDIKKDEKVMFSYDDKIKDLEERIEGYQKAMVNFEKKSYERAKIEVKGKHEKEIKELKKEIIDEIDRITVESCDCELDDEGLTLCTTHIYLVEAKKIIEERL